MRKWLTVGAVAMLAAWLPFLYAELTSEEAERKDRALPTEEGSDEAVEARPVEDETTANAGKGGEAPAAAEAPAQPSAEQPAAAAPTEPAAAPHAPGEPGATAQAPTAPTEGAEEAPGEGEAEGEGDPEAEEAPEPPAASGPVAVLRQAFERQPRDALWAGDVEHRLRSLFGTADVPADLLESASCRSSVCRMEVKWTPERATAYVGVYEASTRLSGTELAIEPVGEADEQGAQKVQLYVTRQGYTMADLAR